MESFYASFEEPAPNLDSHDASSRLRWTCSKQPSRKRYCLSSSSHAKPCQPAFPLKHPSRPPFPISLLNAFSIFLFLTSLFISSLFSNIEREKSKMTDSKNPLTNSKAYSNGTALQK